jgi:MHS family proline/betaine transporter-like MFS transporter
VRKINHAVQPFGSAASSLMPSLEQVSAYFGNFFEWYDMSLFGSFATQIGSAFFPNASPGAQALRSFGIFWLAFATRPLGAVVFGHVGDRYGRLPVLLITIGLMWFATLGIAMLPGYESIGMAAPILLTLLRMLQGFSLGGEGGGGMTYALECTAPANRGRVGAQWQVAGSLGNVFANLFAGVLRASLSPEALASWGWRLPFYLGAMVLVCGGAVRRRLREPPIAAGATPPPANPACHAIQTNGPRMIWLLLVTVLWMVYGFWATVYVPSYLTSRTPEPIDSGYTIAAVMQAINMGGQLLFAELADRRARASGGDEAFRHNLLAAGALACIVAFPLTSLALEHAGAPLATCACLAVAVIHSSYGANVTAFVFSHAGGGHVRLSTLAIMWATGAVAFAGTSPFICEALRQAARGSALAPSAYLSACAAISLGALRLAPSGMLRGDHAEAEAEPDPEGEGEGEAQAGLRSTTSSSRGLPREYTHADTAL